MPSAHITLCIDSIVTVFSINIFWKFPEIWVEIVKQWLFIKYKNLQHITHFLSLPWKSLKEILSLKPLKSLFQLLKLYAKWCCPLPKEKLRSSFSAHCNFWLISTTHYIWKDFWFWNFFFLNCKRNIYQVLRLFQ